MPPLWPVHGEEKVGVSSLDIPCMLFNVLPRAGVFTLGTRRVTTGDSLHGALRLLSLPAPHALISNSDPRMWHHSNSVAGLF
jgi:hypothetical protein